MPVVHCAVTRQVRLGCEAQFDARLLKFVQETIAADGVVGVHLLRPPPKSSCREDGVLRSFESEQAAENFYSSDAFTKWVDEVQPLVEGQPVYRQLTGLEAFFRTERGVMPARWKMAIVTYCGVLPTVLLWSNLLGPALAERHWLLKAIAVNAAVVITLAWVVMPLLTQIFHRWLHHPTSIEIHGRK